MPRLHFVAVIKKNHVQNQPKDCNTKQIGKERIYLFTLSGHSLSLKEAEAGTQGKNMLV